MIKKIKNISVRQALILFILLLGSPSIRLLPADCVEHAGPAAWLAPFIAVIALFFYFLMMQKVFNKYDKEPFFLIVEDIFGKLIGKIVGIIFFLYITFLCAFYIRFYAERLSGSLSINTSYIVYVIILLSLITFIMKFDLPILARMNEILLWVVVFSFIVVDILALPNVSLKNFYPITHLDIVPVLEASLTVLCLWGYATFVFIFSDRISGKANLFKNGRKTCVLLVVLTSLAILIPLGVFGNSAQYLVYPFGSAIQTISLFETIERVEPIIIAVWIITDFSIISTFIFSGLHTLKSVFRLTDSKPLIHIYILLLFFLSIFIAFNVNELRILSEVIIIYTNIVVCFGIPFLLFLVGKIRKKI